jgi:lysozyme
MKTSLDGITRIAKEEGERLTAYFDIAGVPTISVGVTDGVTHDDVRSKRTITKEESQAMFAMALAPRESAVNRLCTRTPTQSQFDALMSLIYNIGVVGFEKSSILKFHNAGEFHAAADAFSLWNKARVNGQLIVVSALSNRRKREADLYLSKVIGVTTEAVTEAAQELPVKAPTIFTVIMAVFKFIMGLVKK